MKPNGAFTIMVADDDDSIRESLRKLLCDEGYGVILAANGVEAVETFRHRHESADLLLIDLNMPRKNGWVAVSELLELNPGLPVFVITGISHQGEMAEGSGVRALVEKPIDVPELLQLIQKQLELPTEPVSCRHIAFHHLHSGGRHLSPGQNADSYEHWGIND